MGDPQTPNPKCIHRTGCVYVTACIQAGRCVSTLAEAKSASSISEERLRNTRAWAAARLGQMSGAEVIVGAIDELLERRAAETSPLPTLPPSLPDADLERIGAALAPVLDALPAMPRHQWHRFSFDVIVGSDDARQVVHVRLAPLGPSLNGPGEPT